jgi:four helix bundle protein
MQKFKFEKLLVWQLAMNYGEIIYGLSRDFPKEETYNLTTQICRAVDSIALNISEGAIGQSNLEQKKFIGYSMRSLAEVITCLHKAIRRNYISEQKFEEVYNLAFELMNRLSAFKNSLNK